MKRILLCLFILLSLTQARASDTLTVRQVFNFSVGDTFDYAETSNIIDYGLYSITYFRVVISQKYVSAAQDTIIYNGNWVITNLDSIAVYQIDTARPLPPNNVNFFDTNSYTGRISNMIYFFNNDGGTYSYLTDSLGVTISGWSMASIMNSGYYTDTYEKRLIYFSDGHRSFGTPYYVADGEVLIHYMPLPESCAYWNMVSTGPPPISDNLYEQIRTGNIIDTFGHHYVEMIYRAYDQYSNYYTPDSLLGYFINDTVGHYVYFTQSIVPFGSQNLLYDFNVIGGTQIGTNYVTITVDTIGGIPRTNWSARQSLLSYPPYEIDHLYNDFMEGIGSEAGLINVRIPYGIPFYTSGLESLCVCGRTIYPDTATGQCALLTGIPNISSTNQQIHLYPNPSTDQIHLSISEMNGSNYQLILTDILGQEVYTSLVTQSETIHDISNLSPGIYTWRLSGPKTPKGGLNAIIGSGKIVKQ